MFRRFALWLLRWIEDIARYYIVTLEEKKWEDKK